jgi:hypothetical protein
VPLRGGLDTLLGPEETGLLFDPLCGVGGVVFSGFAGLGLVSMFVGVGLGCWLLFENCIVDASIFFVALVFKFLRAHGGCLGIRSR